MSSTCPIKANLVTKSFIDSDNPVNGAKNKPEDGNDTLNNRLQVPHFSRVCSACQSLILEENTASAKTRPFLIKLNMSNHEVNSRPQRNCFCKPNSMKSQPYLLFLELPDTIYKDLLTDIQYKQELHDIWNNYNNVNQQVEASLQKDTIVKSTRTDVSCSQASTTVKANPKSRSSQDLKPPMLETGKYSIYLRHKSIVDPESTKWNYTPSINYWHNQLGGHSKLQINLENGTQATGPRNYRNCKPDDTECYLFTNQNIPQLDGVSEIFSDEEPEVEYIQCNSTYEAEYIPGADSSTIYILDSPEKGIPVQPFVESSNSCANIAGFNDVYPYTAVTNRAPELMETYGFGSVIHNTTIPLETSQDEIQPEPVPTVVSMPISLHTFDPSTMNLYSVDNTGGLVYSSPQFAFADTHLPSQQYEMQGLATPACMIQQSYPSMDTTPAYSGVDDSNMNGPTRYLPPQSTTSQQQQQIPAASVSFQPNVPTILGTFVQTNIVETPTYIFNTAITNSAADTQIFGVAAPQSNIILPGQPGLFGLETVMSNAIMPSYQFLTNSHMSNVGAPITYLTRTQVSQAAEPIPQQSGLGSSYIVLNPSTFVPSMPIMLQTNVAQPTTAVTSAATFTSTPLTSSCDQKPEDLQIQMTNEAIRLDQSFSLQPVPMYQLPDAAVHPGNVTDPFPYGTDFCTETQPISQEQKVFPQLTVRDHVTLELGPTTADIDSNVALASITIPPICSTTDDAICHIKQERASPIPEASWSHTSTSSAIQTAPTESISQHLPTLPTGIDLKITETESGTNQFPSLQPSPVPCSQASKPMPSDPNKPITNFSSTVSNAQKEMEQLTNEPIYQSVETEQCHQQPEAEATATPKSASSLPTSSPRVQTSASIPLLVERTPSKPDKVSSKCLTNMSSSSGTSLTTTTSSMASLETPYKFVFPRRKYKPRISNESSLAGDETPKKLTTPPAEAVATARRIGRSRGKENRESTRLGNANPVGGHKAYQTASISSEVEAKDGVSRRTKLLLELGNKILEPLQPSPAKYTEPLLLMPRKFSRGEESVGTPKASNPLIQNKTGCARSEPFVFTPKYHLFRWLSSEYREIPNIIRSDLEIANRQKTPYLPMATQSRHLKDTTEGRVFVSRSSIHGRGLFCLRDIDAEKRVIEYAGEVIRSSLTDLREQYYISKGIDCYMFQIDDEHVVDATMSGNAARFINHSCEPNCRPKIKISRGKKHIFIYTLQKINKGDELTYDYKFPLELDKIVCHCKKPKCRRYLN